MIDDVVVASAGRKGKGVFARRAFARGEFIFRRRNGRVVTSSGIASLSRAERRHLTELDFERSAVLLPPGCYLNHSCEPNATFDMSSPDRSKWQLRALKDIHAGDDSMSTDLLLISTSVYR